MRWATTNNIAHIAMGANNNMIWISTEKSMKRGCCHHLQLFFPSAAGRRPLACLPAASSLHRDVFEACSPHECPASMSGGSQKSLWTRALLVANCSESPRADPSKTFFYKHATILTERCLLWRGYKKGLKRSHVHLPLELAELGCCAVHVSPIDPSFFPVRLVAVACRHHWSRNYQTHTRIIKGQCRHAARLPDCLPAHTARNQASEMLPCAAATTARYYCFIDIPKLRYVPGPV